MTSIAHSDTWRGTAPICKGKCLPGETQIQISENGDGGHCFSGHKALCRNNQPSCPVRETKTDCYGAVQICDNGFYESPTQNWHSCSKYACGVCLGIDSQKLGTTATFGPDTCKQGFVWREAIANDHVCVTPETRAQAARDNSSAVALREPSGGSYGPDTCKQGFVWREVLASDHVCVTPNVRTAAAQDNAMARERKAQ